MKHTLSITLFLVIFFFIAQIFGLFVINKDMKVETTPSGQIETVHGETAIGERPEIKGSSTFIYMIVAVLIGTVLLLVFARFRGFNLWKIWFFFAVWMSMAISLGVFAKAGIALIIAFVLALLKIFRPTFIVHNGTELLVYSGIALLLVPLFTAFWAFMLLIAFSLYDMFAVWKSKHMVKLAKFQMESNVFAGFFIPYRRTKKGIKAEVAKKPEKKAKEIKSAKMAAFAKKQKAYLQKQLPKAAAPGAAEESTNAVLGGGDIALPMIFSGAIMEELVRMQNISKNIALLKASIIPIFAAIALFILLVKSEKGKFYPAMPFIAIGCIIGYIIVLLL